MVGRQGLRANIDFQVADISDNILSLEKLFRNRLAFRLNGGNDSIMYHRHDPTKTVPLFLHKNSFRFHAKRLVNHVSLVAAEDIPVRWSSRSPTNLLDQRLDEFSLPKHGTELDEWTRIEQRGNELLRARKAQAVHDAERTVGPDRTS